MPKETSQNLKTKLKQLLEDNEKFLEQSERRLGKLQLEAEKIMARLSDDEERLDAKIGQAAAELD